jgi:hypothetical protein
MKRKQHLFTCKIFLTMMILFSVFNGQAQEKSELPQKMTDKMKKELSLTEEQYPKVLAANEQFAAQMTALKEGGGSRFSKLKKLKAIDSERDKALKNVLTEVQYTAFLEQKKENRAKARSRAGDRP